MLGGLSDANPEDVVLLHACCHNPTGVDLTRDQWLSVVEVVQSKRLLPLVDIAYQGFGDGLEEDAFIIRELVSRQIPFLVANSFSKNFSLYGERCGALSVVCADSGEVARVTGQLTSIVRGIYSNPPAHGAKLVATVLDSAELYKTWESELSQMRARIVEMRKTLYSLLRERIDEKPLSRYISQRGMFTYTGLSSNQVAVLNAEHAIYLVNSGRMCMAALNHANVERTANAIADVMAAG
jgi:aromatic-amino-acid transaminase